MPKVETLRHLGHPSPLSDAVVKVDKLLQLIFLQHASYEPPDEDEENELDYYSDGEHALYSPLQKLPGGLNR